MLTSRPGRALLDTGVTAYDALGAEHGAGGALETVQLLPGLPRVLCDGGPAPPARGPRRAPALGAPARSARLRVTGAPGAREDRSPSSRWRSRCSRTPLFSSSKSRSSTWARWTCRRAPFPPPARAAESRPRAAGRRRTAFERLRGAERASRSKRRLFQGSRWSTTPASAATSAPTAPNSTTPRSAPPRLTAGCARARC